METTKQLDFGSGHRMRGDERSHESTFILLLLVSCVALATLAFVMWWVPYVGFSYIHPHLPLVAAFLLGALVLLALGGALTLVFTVIWGRNLFFTRRLRGATIRFLFPILVGAGRLIGIGKSKVRRSFLAINNQLVLAEAQKVGPEKLLILLPHCLQNHNCKVRITGNIENCKACGKCKIKDLVTLGKKYDISLSVATGGTLARRIVAQKKPRVIIGVACERDLTSGIQDSYPIPVFGILNRRPFGPCYDTDVDVEMVEKAIGIFLATAEQRLPQGESSIEPRKTGTSPADPERRVRPGRKRASYKEIEHRDGEMAAEGGNDWRSIMGPVSRRNAFCHPGFMDRRLLPF